MEWAPVGLPRRVRARRRGVRLHRPLTTVGQGEDEGDGAVPVPDLRHDPVGRDPDLQLDRLGRVGPDHLREGGRWQPSGPRRSRPPTTPPSGQHGDGHLDEGPERGVGRHDQPDEVCVVRGHAPLSHGVGSAASPPPRRVDRSHRRTRRPTWWRALSCDGARLRAAGATGRRSADSCGAGVAQVPPGLGARSRGSGDVGGGLVIAQAQVAGVPQPPVAGPLAERQLGHQLGAEPDRSPPQLGGRGRRVEGARRSWPGRRTGRTGDRAPRPGSPCRPGRRSARSRHPGSRGSPRAGRRSARRGCPRPGASRPPPSPGGGAPSP